jgi:hypothetical protein
MLREQKLWDVLEAADLIYAVDGATGERCGWFYGDPAIESLPIDPRTPGTAPLVVEIPVDRASDDRANLAGAVWGTKGSCCYTGDLRETLSEPTVVEDLRNADIIYAVDGRTDERCGWFYGDPATESLPIYDLEPWRAPAVVVVKVNPWSDDREVLAEAVWRIKGSCCYPPDEVKSCGADARSDPEFA